ncbi:lysylphosphatidylglycerol synthase transmembrane domain-containing protein [Flavobacterium stagni]|uniref:lysylphosphatidylglycerol synthase transmembrane domain-containing protein n=1 Tax=Flavobacterium stagni TaxID=2506421 RepID=UPI001F28A719|nr:lysylphosphatidylglycerol synthase transmembrane domain-containing protein [Flavobacterium stagni]
MKTSIKNFLLLIIPLFIGCGIIYYQYNSLSTHELDSIKNSLWNANYFYILLSLLVAVISHGARAYRWKFALQHLGYETKMSNNFFTVCVSYLVNLTIPRSGEVTRAALIKKYEDVPFDKAFGTIVAERIIDLAIFFLFVIIGFVLQYEKLHQFFIDQNVSLRTIAFSGIAFLVMAVLFLVIWIYAEWSILLKLKKKLAGLTEGILSVWYMEKKWQYIFHSFLIWGCYLIMFYIPIFALPETENIGFNIVIMGFIFGSLAIGFTNGGIGAFPLSISLIFGLYNIPEEISVAFGWLAWTSQTVLTILLGLIGYLLLPIMNRK